WRSIMRGSVSEITRPDGGPRATIRTTKSATLSTPLPTPLPQGHAAQPAHPPPRPRWTSAACLAYQLPLHFFTTPEAIPMQGYVDDIEEATERNEDFRRVLYTGAHLQLVLMTLQPGEEIGEEVHDDGD